VPVSCKLRTIGGGGVPIRSSTSEAPQRAPVREILVGVVFSTPDLATVPPRARRIVLDPILAGITLGRTDAALVLPARDRGGLRAQSGSGGAVNRPRQGIGGGGFVTT